MANNQPDFSGWATVYNIKCTDGRTIKRGAFDDMDGQRVPLVWQHQHDNPENVLGYAILHSDEQGRGMRTDGYFNDTPKAETAKQILAHGDIDSLSIYANRLTENSRKEVYHGTIKEVSLVMFGANSDARVDYTSLHHADMSLEELYSDAIIYNGVHFQHDGDGDGDGDGVDSGEENGGGDGYDSDVSDDEICDMIADMSDDELSEFLESLDDDELEALNDILEEKGESLSHADEDADQDFGIESSQDLIDAYSALPENEMNLINQFLACVGQKKEVPEDLIKSVASMIESKDKPTQVKLLTMLSIAKGDNS